MSITKSRAKQIIREELTNLTEGYGSSGRGGFGYRHGGDITAFKRRADDTPLYRQSGGGRMSDAEARERGGRGYDEPNEPDYGSGPRGGIVHSTVSIYVDPTGAADKFNANLGPRLDSAADVFLVKTGYDGMGGNLIVGKDMETGFNKIGPGWVLAKSPEGFTFTTGGTVGTGSSPSAALRDAAEKGFEGADVVLGALGGGGLVAMGGEMGELDEARLHKLAGILAD